MFFKNVEWLNKNLLLSTLVQHPSRMIPATLGIGDTLKKEMDCSSFLETLGSEIGLPLRTKVKGKHSSHLHKTIQLLFA